MGTSGVLRAGSMATGYGGMSLARVRTFLELSGADREASDIVTKAGIMVDEDTYATGYSR